MPREYPRVVDSRREKRWTLTPKGQKIPKGRTHPNKIPRCRVCGELATYSSWVQVNWFRGDDEGPFPACNAHKEDAAGLLNPPSPKGPE